jgi:hypothetical protein
MCVYNRSYSSQSVYTFTYLCVYSRTQTNKHWCYWNLCLQLPKRAHMHPQLTRTLASIVYTFEQVHILHMHTFDASNPCSVSRSGCTHMHKWQTDRQTDTHIHEHDHDALPSKIVCHTRTYSTHQILDAHAQVTDIYTHIYMRTYSDAPDLGCTCTSDRHIYTHIHAYIFRRTRSWMHMHMHKWQTYIHTYTCVHIPTHQILDACTCTSDRHTYTHIYMHTTQIYTSDARISCRSK